MKHIIEDFQVEHKRTVFWEKTAALLTAVLVLCLASIFGLSIAASELTKTIRATNENVLTVNSQAALTGAQSAMAEVHDSRRRRLFLDRRGLEQVSLASVPEAVAAKARMILAETNDPSGSVSVEIPQGEGSSSVNMIYQGSVVATPVGNDKEYTIENLPSTINPSQQQYTFNSDTNVVSEPARRQMRALDEAEAGVWRRRRLAAAGNASEPRAHELACEVFACFEGDKDCSLPSPPSECLVWDEGTKGAGKVCAEPMCLRVHKSVAPGHEAIGRLLGESRELSVANCFDRQVAVACRVLDRATSAHAAFDACFGTGAEAGGAELVLMTELTAGDLVLDGSSTPTRVGLNIHKRDFETRESMLTLHHLDGSVTLTPDHALCTSAGTRTLADPHPLLTDPRSSPSCKRHRRRARRRSRREGWRAPA